METSMDRAYVRKLYMEKYEENKASIDARIEEGIEKNRKGTCQIQFLDANGTHLKGQKIKIMQRTHDFKYGANLFLLDEFPDEEDNRKYRDAFKEYFNLATVPFYWDTLEPEDGKPRYAADSEKIYRRPAPDLCMEYCEENGIMPKLHCLFYDKFAPEWMIGWDEEKVKSRIEQRFQEISERYQGRMFEFEVTNEVFIVPNRKTLKGSAKDIISWCFELAKKYFPNERLTINETGVIPDIASSTYGHLYFSLCNGLLKQGTAIDCIGVQNHLLVGVASNTQEEYDESVLEHIPRNDPMMYFKSLDVLGELGKPVEITEVTLPTFGDTLEDEELQADILKLSYSIWFSHPAVDCIVYWNTVDNCTYEVKGWNENHARGGLWHRDLTPKKSAIMLKKLFQEIWHTELELVTDENGYVEFRGFYGDYEMEAGNETYQFGIHKDAENQIKISSK